MAVDIVASGRNITQFNGPLQMPIWDGLPGTREGQFAWDQAGVIEPLFGPGEIVWNGTAWERNTTSGSTPGLQEVTDVNAVTDNSVTISTTGISDIGTENPPEMAQFVALNDSGSAAARLQAFSYDNGSTDEYVSQLVLQGDTVRITISQGINLDILDDNNTLLLRVLANGKGIHFMNGIRDIIGSGSPEGIETAPPSSTFRQINGVAGSTFWVKQSGTGNTGWAPLA